MKLKTFFLILILGGILPSFARGEAVIFCVKPSQPSIINCLSLDKECHHCNTLQYYLDNVDATINTQENVTLLFMKGTHMIKSSSVYLNTSVLKMKGTDFENASINCSQPQESVLQFSCVFYMINTDKLTVYSIGSITMIGVLLVTFDSTYFGYIPSSPLYKKTDVSLISVTLNKSHIEFLYSSYTTVTINIEFVVMDSGGIGAVNTDSILFEHSSLHNSHVMLSGVTNTIVKDCTFWSSKLIAQISNIVFSGVTELIGTNGGYESMISSYSSNITLSGTASFTNNLGIRGGAMALHSSTLSIAAGANVSFINNSAFEKGGAIYIEPGMMSRSDMRTTLALSDLEVGLLTKRIKPLCFYQLLDCSANSTYLLNFANNSAEYGGDDIYGASLLLSGLICRTSQSGHNCNLTINGRSSDLSSISSDPLRVCVCDDQGKPLCGGTYDYMYTLISRKVRPGEAFNVSAVLMGGDFGTTTGRVYASFLFPASITLKPSSQSITDSSRCGELEYSLYTNHTNHEDKLVLYLTTSFMSKDVASLYYYYHNYSQYHSYNTPVFIDITLLKCPVGFILLGDPPGCVCYPVLSENGIKCKLVDGTGYLLWNSNSIWIDATKDIVTYTKYCPFDYCTADNKKLDMMSDSNTQCAFNRAGRLCGGCKENYSLAIGSSHCIHCPNNNNLALLIFFAAAGFLLVFFISAFNLTVTQGRINGLIFYANIVWIYQSIFITQINKVNGVLTFLKIFIAWINLDFGIETCFVSGLDAFWKTWLQFIFPLYIWAIAGVIIVATKHSSKLTTLLGNRAVPVLNTLFLLSYMKLLRVIASAMEFSTLQEYSPLSTHADRLIIVWSADGNLPYFGFPHILLFTAGLATLLFLWLPYTLLLFLLQWLRRLSHVKILKWITRFHPVYDAYFAPLKHKHQYWFGVLLLARGILLVTFTSTFGISNTINLFLLLILGIVLLFYMTLMQPYKSAAILLLQSSFLINLIILSGFDVFAYTQPNKQALKEIAFGISTGITFAQFCVIVLYSMVGSWCTYRRRQVENDNQNDNDDAEPIPAVAIDSHSISLRDSIFEESQNLLIDNP